MNTLTDQSLEAKISEYLLGKIVKEMDKTPTFTNGFKLFTHHGPEIDIRLISPDKHSKEEFIVVLLGSEEKLRFPKDRLISQKLLKTHKHMNFLLGSTRIDEKNVVFFVALKQTDTMYLGKDDFHIDSPIPADNVTIKRIF